MALVKRPADAFDYAREFIKRMPLENVQQQILDDVNKIIWMAAPWGWTVGVCEPITITANTSEFNLVSPPSDFLYILRAFIWDGQTAIELDPEPALPDDITMLGKPNKIAYVSGVTPKFRLHPVFGSVDLTKTYKLVVWYKKTAPNITKRNMYTAGSLLMPDEWFHVYEAGVIWQTYKYANDQRAGSAQSSSTGQTTATGDLGVFLYLLNNMRQSEPMLTAFQKTAPDAQRTIG